MSVSNLAVVNSRGKYGVQAPHVVVEVHITGGLPNFTIVGLPETAVKESRDRVRSAIINSQFDFPSRRITVNLAPADTPKEGGRFDLPIAMGILGAMRQVLTKQFADYEFAAELALSGELRPVQGMLPFALATHKAGRKLIVAAENAAEAALIDDLEVLPAQHLLEVCRHFNGDKQLEPFIPTSDQSPLLTELDMSDVKGQYQARRGLEIAAAGGHSLLFIGPPGTGKTMLASRLPGIMPQLESTQALEVAAIQSISKTKFDPQTWRQRPFRAPHHSASSVALVGGGSPPRPGEISLAHYGVLFLDEFPEFNRQVLETLREPLEAKSISIARAAQQVTFPANFQLVAAMNPCPCGYLNDPKKDCRCTVEQVQRYHARLSGPLLDRIDLHIEVPALPQHFFTKLHNEAAEGSEVIRERVQQAHSVQQQRNTTMNAQLAGKQLQAICQLTGDDQAFLHDSIEKLNLSARAYHRVLRVARTIADLAHAESITKQHLAEALNYRNLDKA